MSYISKKLIFSYLVIYFKEPGGNTSISTHWWQDILFFSIESMLRCLEDRDINSLIDGYVFYEIDGKDVNDSKKGTTGSAMQYQQSC